MAIYASVKIEGPDSAGVARVILNRPHRANAVNNELFRELPLALREVDDSPDTRVIILSAAGEKHFCSGLDLDVMAKSSSLVHTDEETGRREFGKGRNVWWRYILDIQDSFTAIEKCRKPVIAAIHGPCVGAGIDLISACDLRYSTENSVFAVLEVDLAITADLGTLQRLPHIVGYAKAMELALTARRFDGKEAFMMGLVHGVYPTRESLEKGVREVAGVIASKSNLAIIGTKAMLLKSRDVSVAEGLSAVATWNAAHLWPDEVQEAMAATREKRKPIFAKL